MGPYEPFCNQRRALSFARSAAPRTVIITAVRLNIATSNDIKACALQHEPRGLLGNSHGAVNLPRRNAVLAVSHQPNNRKPLIQTERRVFQNGSSLQGELTLRMMTGTLPAPRLSVVFDLSATACRASNSVRPTLRGHVSYAVIGIGEVSNCFLKSAGRLNFHKSIIGQNSGPAKYIFTLSFLPTAGLPPSQSHIAPTSVQAGASICDRLRPKKKPLWVVAVFHGRRTPRVMAAILRGRK